MFNNQYRFNTPNGWNNINDAPRDGTIIEIQNNFGIAPTFRICRWSKDCHSPGWKDANDTTRGVVDGPHLSWRPYKGEVGSYVDPTNGAQETLAYWSMARIFRGDFS